MRPIAIPGAGLAGLSAAKALIAAGRRGRLIDASRAESARESGMAPARRVLAA